MTLARDILKLMMYSKSLIFIIYYIKIYFQPFLNYKYFLMKYASNFSIWAVLFPSIIFNIIYIDKI